MRRAAWIGVLLLLAGVRPLSADDVGVADELLTVAERSDFRATATHAQILAIVEALVDRSPLVQQTSMGTTSEGRDIPMLIIADPPVSTPDEAHASGKLIVLLLGAIHGGEVCGKEALLILARELSHDDPEPWVRDVLRDTIILMAPVFNADGAERIAVGHRPGQIGPELGTGIRANAQGLDLNRDYIKLSSPEVRALVSCSNRWDPHVTIDTHTTNGSEHRYELTYSAPLNPSGDLRPIELLRDRLLPDITRQLHKRTGYETFFYGNFNDDRTEWRTYSALPRFGGQYRGLRNRMSILSEAYAYAPYRTRVLATHAFVQECLVQLAAAKEEVIRVLSQADEATMQAGARFDADDQVGIRHEIAALPEQAEILTWTDVEQTDAAPGPAPAPITLMCTHFGRFEATHRVVRPLGYIVPRNQARVIEKLEQHGILHEPLAHGRVLDVEVHTIRSIARSETPYEGVRTVTVEADVVGDRRAVSPGDIFVSTSQPLGNLVVYLLEPESEDGLATWDLIDSDMVAGHEFPIWRVITR